MKTTLLFLAAIFLYPAIVPAQTVGLTKHQAGTQEGYIFFSPAAARESFLINTCGELIRRWPSTTNTGHKAFLNNNGEVIRAGALSNTIINGGGGGGLLEKYSWNGNLLWQYKMNDSLQRQHHDLIEMPNGNILAHIWILKTKEEAVAAGRDSTQVASSIWSENIVELQPVGADSAVIVWEWHAWDHLVQDLDSTKPNFASVNANPQLIDINYNNGVGVLDWLHGNGLDYNAELDQIIISMHAFDEFWILDHSTTTQQAASHTGGLAGKGGDLLYRWGNPATYKQPGTQHLYRQHNPHWIPKGLPNENKIMIFNNGLQRPGGDYTTVEIIDPPLVGYNYTQTLPYLPVNPVWIYNQGNPNNYFSKNLSGAQQLSSGNVLIDDGPAGRFFQIDTAKNKVWEYINPAKLGGAAQQGDTIILNNTFRCIYYPANYVGFDGKSLQPIGLIENVNPLSAQCQMVGIKESAANDFKIEIYPVPAQNYLSIHLPVATTESWKLNLYNMQGQLCKNYEMTSSNFQMPTRDLPDGLYMLRVIHDGRMQQYKISIQH